MVFKWLRMHNNKWPHQLLYVAEHLLIHICVQGTGNEARRCYLASVSFAKWMDARISAVIFIYSLGVLKVFSHLFAVRSNHFLRCQLIWNVSTLLRCLPVGRNRPVCFSVSRSFTVRWQMAGFIAAIKPNACHPPSDRRFYQQNTRRRTLSNLLECRYDFLLPRHRNSNGQNIGMSTQDYQIAKTPIKHFHRIHIRKPIYRSNYGFYGKPQHGKKYEQKQPIKITNT